MAEFQELLRVEAAYRYCIVVSGPESPVRKDTPCAAGLIVVAMDGNIPTVRVLGDEWKGGVAPFLFEQTNYLLQLEVSDGAVELERVRLLLRGLNLLAHAKPIGRSRTFSVPLNFGSSVGYTYLELWLGSALAVKLRVEVFPTKLDYRTDFLMLRADLNQEVRALAFSLGGKTFHYASRSRGSQATAVEWLENLRQLFDRLLNALSTIARSPRTTIDVEERFVRGDRPTRAGRAALRYLRTHGASCFQISPGNFSARGNAWRVAMMPTERKVTSCRTAENYYVKWCLERILRRLRSNIQELRGLPGNDEWVEWRRLLEKKEWDIRQFLSRTFLQDVKEAHGAPMPTLALHLTPGYREFFTLILDLFTGLQVSVEGMEISEKDLAILYEIWCFVKLGSLLRSYCGFKQTRPDWLKIQRGVLGLRLRRGRTSTLVLNSPTGEQITLMYNPQRLTPTGSCYPDNLLEVRKASRRSPFRYVFDAKYRYKDDAEYIKAFSAPGPPEEAVHRMHAYRDQIVSDSEAAHEGIEQESTVWDVGERRYVRENAGAVVLYPNSRADAHLNSFFASVERVGIGALPFLPTRTGEVCNLLERIIASTDETDEDRAVELSSIRERQRIEWAHQYGLVAIVKSPDQLSYIRQTGIYHMPYMALKGVRLRAEFILFLQSSRSFPREGGVRYWAKVRSFEVGPREAISPAPPGQGARADMGRLYAWFKVEDLQSLRAPLAYEGRPPFFGITTRLVWYEASSVEELLLVREPELRLYKELRRGGFAVRVMEDSRGRKPFYDLKDLRLRFMVLGAKHTRLEIRFNPGTAKFHMSSGGRFSWRDLMFEAEKCLRIVRSELAREPGIEDR